MKNPYKAGEWAQGREFYGRRHLIDHLLDGHTQCVCLIGNRRMGKTSLLRQIEERTWQNPAQLALFIDLSSIDASLDAIWVEIARQLQHATRKHTCLAEGLRSDLRRLAKSNFPDIRTALDALAELAEARHLDITLLFDEAEQLVGFHSQDDPKKMVDLDHLGGALHCRSNVRSILTASKRIYRLNDLQAQKITQTFLQGFTMEYLPPLEYDEAQALVCQEQNLDEWGAPLPVRVDPVLMHEILTLTGRHPYWIHFLCRRLFEENSILRAIQPKDLVVEAIQLDYFQMDFNSLSFQEQSILLELARGSLATAEQLFKNLNKGGTKAHFPSVLLELERLGLIRTAGQEYLVGNHFFQTWLEDDSLQPTQPSPLPAAPHVFQKKRFIQALKKVFIEFPAGIGRFILDLLGRTKTAKSTQVIVGYIAILLVLFLISGIIAPKTLWQVFEKIWRFFNPL